MKTSAVRDEKRGGGWGKGRGRLLAAGLPQTRVPAYPSSPVHGVTLDGSHLASACLSIAATMGAVLDSSSAVFGFRDVGVALRGGHEAMISDTWVAAYFWSSPLKERNNAVRRGARGGDPSSLWTLP